MLFIYYYYFVKIEKNVLCVILASFNIVLLGKQNC